MMYQREAQFLESYGRERQTQNQFNGFNQKPEPSDSLWDKLGRIFTFGCIETNHNNK